LCLNTSKSRCHFPQYKWEMQQSETWLLEFNVDIIPIESIQDYAFVIPNFSTNPICGQPIETDRFCLIPRSFFDRSGWENVTSLVPSPPLPTQFYQSATVATSNRPTKLCLEIIDGEDDCSDCSSFIGSDNYTDCSGNVN
jgi:hypothetical protein